jgi:hypothetical protein
MKLKTMICLASLILFGVTFAEELLPTEVESFIKNADACDHFAAEFDGGLSTKRQREIERQVVKYCRPAQRQLRQLSKKYRDNPKISKILHSHANDAVTGFR